jgi:hypothetical protein
MQVQVERKRLEILRDAVIRASAANADMRREVEELLGETSGPSLPVLSASELKRVTQNGPWAIDHEDFMNGHGGNMSLGDSRVIRRSKTGSLKDMRGTVKLFGKDADSLAILYRKGGKYPKDSDEVFLTREGQRVAELYRKLYLTPPPESA